MFLSVHLAVSDYTEQSARQRLLIRRILLTPGIHPVLLALFAWILAHDILYTFMS